MTLQDAILDRLDSIGFSVHQLAECIRRAGDVEQLCLARMFIALADVDAGMDRQLVAIREAAMAATLASEHDVEVTF